MLNTYSTSTVSYIKHLKPIASRFYSNLEINLQILIKTEYNHIQTDIHKHIHTNTYTSTHIHTNIDTYIVHTHRCIRTCTHKQIQIYTHTCIYIYTSAYVEVPWSLCRRRSALLRRKSWSRSSSQNL